MKKHLTKVNYNEIRDNAAKIVGLNPAITDREVCEILSISRTGFTKIKQDRIFHEKMEDVFEKNITRDLLLVDVAMISEAQKGNVQAARYLAERHGKFVKKYQIEVKSPYELFAKEVETAEYEELGEYHVSKADLPPRDARNDKPLTRAIEEKKQLNSTLKKFKREKHPQFIADRQDRAALRERAKAVGLKPMSRGKPTKDKRDRWISELLRLEEEKRGYK